VIPWFEEGVADARHDACVGNRQKVIFAAVLVVLGLAGCAWFLTGQGLDNAEKWVSLVGMFVSAGLGVAGVVLGWVSWRSVRHQGRPVTSALGAGAAAIDGPNSGKLDLQASGLKDGGRDGAAPAGEVSASGHAAAAIRGYNTGDITTRFDGRPRRRKKK
jgi:hypothetical protein